MEPLLTTPRAAAGIGPRLTHCAALLALIGVPALAACAPTAASLAVDGAYTASEERTMDEVVDDNAIKLELNRLLIDEGLGLFKDVGTVVYQGHVYLLGDVTDATAKARAGELAHQPKGVRSVVNDIQVTDEGGLGSAVDDIYIEKRIQADYLFDSEIDSANFRVRSVNGVVYLIGQAESRAELDKALAIVKARDDVKRIVNYVTVKRAG